MASVGTSGPVPDTTTEHARARRDRCYAITMNLYSTHPRIMLAKVSNVLNAHVHDGLARGGVRGSPRLGPRFPDLASVRARRFNVPIISGDFR